MPDQLPAHTVARFPLTAFLEVTLESHDGVGILPIEAADASNMRVVSRRIVVEHRGAPVAEVVLATGGDPIVFDLASPAGRIVGEQAALSAG